jgi:hypothetical protein
LPLRISEREVTATPVPRTSSACVKACSSMLRVHGPRVIVVQQRTKVRQHERRSSRYRAEATSEGASICSDRCAQ